MAVSLMINSSFQQLADLKGEINYGDNPAKASRVLMGSSLPTAQIWGWMLTSQWLDQVTGLVPMEEIWSAWRLFLILLKKIPM